MKNNELRAFNNDDIKGLLKSLNVYDDVVNGRKKCIFCDDMVNLDTIDAILPVDQKVEFSCNKTDCHNKLLTQVRDKDVF